MSGKRKSTRGSGRVSYAEPVGDDVSDADEAFDEETKAKRRKTAQKELAKAKRKVKKEAELDVDWQKARRKQQKGAKRQKDAGKLSNIFTLSMDILATIMEKLEPLDLLHLARTNRQLRAFLTSAESSSVWVRSRANMVLYIPKNQSYHYYPDSEDDEPPQEEYEAVPMPEKPGNLSHMGYARLMFDKSCHVCGAAAKRNHRTLPNNQARLCTGCYRHGTTTKEGVESALLKQIAPGEAIEQEVFDIVPGKGFYVSAHVFSAHKTYKSKKATLGHEEFRSWVDGLKEAVSKIGGDDGCAEWCEKYDSYGRDEARRARRDQYFHSARRRTALRARALQEPWWQASAWNSYAGSPQAHKLFNKKGDVTDAEWHSVRTAIETELVARTAFVQEQVNYERQSRTRDFIRSQHAESCLSISKDLPGYGLPIGCLLALPEGQVIFDKIEKVYEEEDAAVKASAADPASMQEDEDYEGLYKARLEARRAAVGKRKEIWQEHSEELKKQAEERQVEILEDLSARLLQYFPTHPDPAKTVEAVRNEKGDSVDSLDVLKALFKDLSAPHALFSCSRCDGGHRISYREGSQLLNASTMFKHPHLATELVQSNYNRKTSYYSSSRVSGWQSDLVELPPDLVFATKMLVELCGKGKVAKCEDKKFEPDESKPFAYPSTIDDFDAIWSFNCSHGDYCGFSNRYDSLAGKLVSEPVQRQWQPMAAHLQDHYASAQDLSDTLVTQSALHIMVKKEKPATTTHHSHTFDMDMDMDMDVVPPDYLASIMGAHAAYDSDFDDDY